MQNRHSRNGSMGASNGAHGSSNAAAAARFEGPRSPPNTSHVPCKFFRQGACQAGNACPFSHDLGAAADNICKYFAKGNCKFGPKCANIHVLPDGRRINYSKNGVTIGNGPVNLGARSAQTPTSPTSSTPATNGADHNRSQASASALTNSLYRADQSSLSTFPSTTATINTTFASNLASRMAFQSSMRLTPTRAQRMARLVTKILGSGWVCLLPTARAYLSWMPPPRFIRFQRHIQCCSLPRWPMAVFCSLQIWSRIALSLAEHCCQGLAYLGNPSASPHTSIWFI
uniref:C3H1-type domain-containing protein n=1 Tax=Bionectria ochroleuca TaxID=29856 RepID=A0A8H7MZF7_BIOOC